MEPLLNFPPYQPRIRVTAGGGRDIFDPVRRKFVKLTPEEWVRQHLLNYLTQVKGYPISLIAVEASLTYNRQARRCDVLVCSSTGKPLLVAECKAPAVPLTQSVFDQVAMYNMTFRVGFVVVTNGLEHFACRIDQLQHSYAFLREIPDYETLTQP